MSIIERTKPKPGSLVELFDQFRAESEGIGSIKLPHRELNFVTGGGLRKGFSSVLAGPPGNGKSYFVYGLLLNCVRNEVPVVYIPLEYSRADHMRRIMAVAINSWAMVSDDEHGAKKREGVFTNNAAATIEYEKIEQYVLENPGRTVFDSYGRPQIPEVPYSDVVELVQHYAENKGLIIVDPITAIDEEQGKGADYKQQESFIKKIKSIASHTKSHIMLVGHSRRRQRHNGKTLSLSTDDVAGSIALSRFAQYMLLLDYHDTRNSTCIAPEGNREAIEHTRTMIVGKCTFGPGTGKRIAFDFDGGPEMTERGLICADE